MVLTRRAYKSIVRWLPNEILAEVIRCLDSYRDLRALCQTSRLINGIAIPLLYREVVLSTLPEIESFLSTLKKYAESPVPRANHVRIFAIQALELQLSESLVDEITSMLADFPNLESLEIFSIKNYFPNMLLHAYFPNLSALTYCVYPRYCAPLSVFINRHPHITDLVLYRPTNDTQSQLDPIHLPNITDYTGPRSFLTSFDSDTTTSLKNIDLCWFPQDLNTEPAFLEHLATIMPHISTFRFNKAFSSACITWAHAMEISATLKKFTALTSLEFRGLEEAPPAEGEVPDHIAALIAKMATSGTIVEAWGAACKTLVEVHLGERPFRCYASSNSSDPRRWHRLEKDRNGLGNRRLNEPQPMRLADLRSL
ncbi:hypothetical protein C8R44DRAFT_790274 [Mycena epipterygia]|nr:hypothetical protein C8R44DRAFT_790274 [Mycena epipterygia]